MTPLQTHNTNTHAQPIGPIGCLASQLAIYSCMSHNTIRYLPLAKCSCSNSQPNQDMASAMSRHTKSSDTDNMQGASYAYNLDLRF
uniref:Uncharacterized protein n=1 Tax=Oryza brachyantha TaxID=4533 RepID=J3M679_ORYBR